LQAQSAGSPPMAQSAGTRHPMAQKPVSPPVVPDSEEPSEELLPVEPELLLDASEVELLPESEDASEEELLPVEPVSVELPLPPEELPASVEVESRPLLDDGGTEGPVLVLGSPDSELPEPVGGGASLHAVAAKRPEATSTVRRIDGIRGFVSMAPA
jgi:hypothetical protein